MSNVSEREEFVFWLGVVFFAYFFVGALEHGTAQSVIAGYEELRVPAPDICSDFEALEVYQDKVRRANWDIGLHRQTRKVPVIADLISPVEWQSVANLAEPCPQTP